MRRWLGNQLFSLACKTNPAIPLAMKQVVEQCAAEIAKQNLERQQAATNEAVTLALHRQSVAARAARQ